MARLVTIDGITASIRVHAERIGISYHTVMHRMCTKYWSPEEALTTPIQQAMLVEHDGEKLTAAELSARLGLAKSSVYQRIAHGKTTLPRACPERYSHKGEMLTIREIAERENVCRSTVYGRVRGRTAAPGKRGPKAKTVALDGIEATIAEHAARTGATRQAVGKWARTTGKSGTAHGPQGPYMPREKKR